MKHLLTFSGLLSIMSSCIFDYADDNFYRTIWVSEETPFSDVSQTSDGRITIEFLCGSSISVTATGAAGSYGTYQTCGNTAYFANLTLTFYGDGAAVVSNYRQSKEDESSASESVEDPGKGIVSGETSNNVTNRKDEMVSEIINDKAKIVIKEAHRTGDLLLVSWHREGSETSFSTRFILHSLYE